MFDDLVFKFIPISVIFRKVCPCHFLFRDSRFCERYRINDAGFIRVPAFIVLCFRLVQEFKLCRFFCSVHTSPDFCNLDGFRRIICYQHIRDLTFVASLFLIVYMICICSASRIIRGIFVILCTTDSCSILLFAKNACRIIGMPFYRSEIKGINRISCPILSGKNFHCRKIFQCLLPFPLIIRGNGKGIWCSV